MPTSTAPIADRIARRVFRGLAALPLGLQRRLGGRPIRIDGQELHPTAQMGLRLLNLLAGETYETKPVAQGRIELMREAWIFGDEHPVGQLRDFSIDGPHGPIPVRLYQPAQVRRDLPLLVYYHGGGWVLGDLGAADAVARFLVQLTGISVLSVDYRLAPEHRFPVGVDDALAAFDYAAAHAADFGCDPRRVAVAGESAGGNLSAVISQVCTQRRHSDAQAPVPAFQMLFQPVTDLSGKHPSYRLFSKGFFLSEAQMDWFKAHYLRRPEDAYDPRVSPLLAPDLRGLPPAYIAVSGFDTLRDEGEAYARRLAEAGVPVALRRFASLTHGLINATGVGKVAQDMLREIAGALLVLNAQIGAGDAEWR